MAKGNFPLRLSFIGEVEGWAKGKGMSVNAAIGFMCREFLDRERMGFGALEEENANLKQTLVNLAMSMRDIKTNREVKWGLSLLLDEEMGENHNIVCEGGWMDEWYCTWYVCPVCHSNEGIMKDFKFCPYCGKELDWSEINGD